MRQTSFGFTQPTPTGVNFDGAGVNGFAPPDNDGVVGPNHYIQMINVQFSIYDKTGRLLFGPARNSALFAALGGDCAGHNDGDPIVKYDQLADRWVLTQFLVGGSTSFSHQCVALSVTGDPLGAYYLYDFPTGPSVFVDYPHWGVWPDSYYMTAHLFNTAGTAYLGQGVLAYDRLSMLAGLPAGFQFINLAVVNPNWGGALPTDLDGLTPPPPGSPNYVIAPGAPELDSSASDVLHVFQARATWGASPSFTITGPTDVATSGFIANLCGVSRACIPEPPPATAADYVDAISDRLMYRIAYRNFLPDHESLVLNHTVNVAVSGVHAGVRWYEVRSPSSPTIFQEGTYAPDTSNRWMASIAMDNSGDMALGYSKSDTGIFPEIDITGRLSSDGAGTMGSEVLMKAGLGSQTGTGNRWGDYSYMSVDPTDGCTFWYTNQYEQASGSFNWSTRIASFRFPSCV
ncbi:MAG TPA: hypothetical protein VLL25_14075, partial [Acidimicrobiales bacterium]|nr:hypothetical protein [Acidimicrobiales bacterium]